MSTTIADIIRNIRPPNIAGNAISGYTAGVQLNKMNLDNAKSKSINEMIANLDPSNMSRGDAQKLAFLSGDYQGAYDMSKPFSGTGMDAQAFNILMNDDPSSQRYALAYNYATEPRTQMTQDGMVSITPTLPEGIAPPTYGIPEQIARPPESPGGASDTAGIYSDQNVLTAYQKEYNEKYTASVDLIDALNRYAQLAERIIPDNAAGWANVSRADRARLNTAYTNLETLSKGGALYDLGVLAGDDLTLITTALLDPTSAKGMGYGRDAVLSSTDEVARLLMNKIGRVNETYSGGNVQVKDMPGVYKFTAPESIPTVSTQEAYNDLPKGALFYEDGKRYRKP